MENCKNEEKWVFILHWWDKYQEASICSLQIDEVCFLKSGEIIIDPDIQKNSDTCSEHLDLT